MTRILMALTFAAFLSACAGVQVTDYQDMHPAFDPEQFFEGKLTAQGVVKNRGGKVTRSFTADIIAYWNDGIGTLEEDFLFDDGEEQRRIWTLPPDGPDKYIGTAPDVVGDAEMQVAGNSMFLDYVLPIPSGDGTIDLTVEYRMYKVSDNVLINESKMYKFGVRVGELVLVIMRLPNE